MPALRSPGRSAPFHRRPSAARLAQWREWLDEAAERFERPDFLDDDPLGIPHRYSDPQDVAVAGFFAATLAWGNRKSILKSCHALLDRMDDAPADFVASAGDAELARLDDFVHRTFQGEDARRFVLCLRSLQADGGLHGAFRHAFSTAPDTPGRPGVPDAGHALNAFKTRFFRDHPAGRTSKHVADPVKGSAAKRLCMYLRWMVRSDQRGVDLGLWTDIPRSALRLPLDVHTGNVARELGLLQRKASDWPAVEEVTDVLRKLDPKDPVRYDFALFGMGVTRALKIK
ncbi:MAG: TIGR02757 family protein [Crocinitomicaceae bacterium TMED114]|nr:MAG: TIGR02757 family protein [Crocinitomicaceae bacterium TMED114]